MDMTDAARCPACGHDALERTRFFRRQVVTPEDFTQDQVYFREKMRRHNRMLHGWGVVCGARCKLGAGSHEIVVEPGYLLGPWGDEITIDREVTIDVSSQDLDGNVAGPCGVPADPWCSQVRVARRAGEKLYLAVRYAEVEDRPVPAAGGACGCEERECQYSRIRDSFVLRVLSSLPRSYAAPLSPPPAPLESFECVPHGPHVCRPCPEEPWVVLADITLGNDGTVARLDCFEHRRHVASFADFYYLCSQQSLRVESVEFLRADRRLALPDPPPLPPRSLTLDFRPRSIQVRFSGRDVDPGTVIAGGSFRVSQLNPAGFGIEETGVVPGTVTQLEPNVFEWKARAAAGLAPGPYLVTLAGTPRDLADGTHVDPIRSTTPDPVPLDASAELRARREGMPGSDLAFVVQVTPPR
jgi:hypothetical protein